MEDWEEIEDWEEKEERRAREVMRSIPYIVDVFRKHDALATTYNYLKCERNGQLFELGRQLMIYMKNDLTSEFFRTIVKATCDIEVDFWVRGERNRLITKIEQSELSPQDIVSLHARAKSINSELRIISDYWEMCGYTLPQSSNGLLDLMTRIYC